MNYWPRALEEDKLNMKVLISHTYLHPALHPRTIYEAPIIFEILVNFYKSLTLPNTIQLLKFWQKVLTDIYCNVNYLSKCYLTYLVKILWKDKFLEKCKMWFQIWLVLCKYSFHRDFPVVKSLFWSLWWNKCHFPTSRH